MRSNKRFITALVLAAIGVGGTYAFRRVQHTRHDLVTLNVRNTPLGQVLAHIARQTRETIVAHRSLEIPINLQVTAAPLAEVLDLIAEQTGAFWRRTDAVHQSDKGLVNLVRAIESGVAGVPVGWTNPAPKPGFPIGDLAGDATAGPGSPRPHRLPFPPSDDRRLVDGPQIPPTDAPEPSEADGPVRKGRVLRFTHRPPPGTSGNEDRPETLRPPQTAVVIKHGEQGAEIIDLSPSRLLLEEPLVPRVADLCSEVPNPELADRMATRIRGYHSVLYSLEASPVPEMAGEIRHQVEFKGSAGPHHVASSEGSASSGRPPGLPPDIDAEVRRHRFDRLSRLSPEQRARQQSQRSPRGLPGDGPASGPSVDVEVLQ